MWSLNEILIYWMGCFRLLCLKKPQHQQKNHTKNPWTQHCPNKATMLTLPAVSAFWCLCLSFLHPQKSSKWQEKLQTVGKHWVLGQLQLSSLAGSALQIILHLLLITNIHRTAQGKEVFCYHFTTTRTHCRSAASGRNWSLANMNLPLLLFKVLTSAAAINRQDKA